MPLLGKLANWCGGSRRVFVKQLWSFTKRGNDPKLTGHLNLISFTCPVKVKHTKWAHGTNPQVTMAQSSLSPKWMNVVYPTINLPKCPIFHMLGVLSRKYVYYILLWVLSCFITFKIINQPTIAVTRLFWSCDCWTSAADVSPCFASWSQFEAVPGRVSTSRPWWREDSWTSLVDLHGERWTPPTNQAYSWVLTM